MNLLEFLLEVLHSAINFFEYIYDHNYSFLKKELLGVSLTDVLGLLVCFYIIKELFLMIVSTCRSVFDRFAGNIYSYLFNYFMIGINNVLVRCYYTLQFFWELEKVRERRIALLTKIKHHHLTIQKSITKKLNP